LEEKLIRSLQKQVRPDVRIFPQNRDIRIRHVVKDGLNYYLLFNEGEAECFAQVEFSVKGRRHEWDAVLLDFKERKRQEIVRLPAHQIKVIMVEESL
jgi:hypothetical protein